MDLSAFASRTWDARDGVSIYARDYAGADGAARLPVICLHGLTRNSADFEEVAGSIAASSRRVIVPDMRGRGRSGYDPDAMNYVPRTYARDVIDLLDALGIARAVFLGTSMGGIITMLVASMRGSMVSAAILNDIGPEAAPEGLARIAGYAGKSVDIADWDAATSYVRAINEAAFPDLGPDDWEAFAHRTFREDQNGRPVLDYDPRIREPIAAGRLKAPRFVGWWLFRRLARRRRPVLVIRGALSDILSRDISRRMKRAAPSIELVEIDRVGHAPRLSEPQADAAIRDFLSRTD